MPRTYAWTKLRLQKLATRLEIPMAIRQWMDISREYVAIWYDLDTQEDALAAAEKIAEATGLTILNNGSKYTISTATINSIFRINTR